MNLWRTQSITVSADADGLSNAIDLADGVLVAVIVSGTWTAAALTFLSGDKLTDGTFKSLYDDNGTEISIASGNVTAGRLVSFRTALIDAMKSVRFLKLRSGVVATPVQQAAARTLTVITRQL
jgi:hypothetical protein